MSDEDPNEMDFSDIADIYSQDRSTNSLTRLPDQFYLKAISFIKSMFARIENERSDVKQVPDKDSLRLASEYQRSMAVLENIYNNRERKIVLAALNASRGVEQRTENMTEDEKELFFNLKVELENKRDRAIRFDRALSRPQHIRPETGIDTSTDDYVMEDPVKDRVAKKAKEIGSVLLPKEKECMLPRAVEARAQMEGKAQVERTDGDCLSGYTVVRALVDIGSFSCGEGVNVTMTRNDIATLPEDIAKALVEEGMVVVLEGPA